jgi:hypothetical protein
MRELAPVQTLDQETFAIAFDAMEQGEPQLAHNGDRFRLGRILGQGGTKSVYDAQLSGEQLALALPNTVDGTAKAAQKWQDALREPPVTDVVRELGFLVNTRCDVTPITVDGTIFPAITLNRYADLPVEVRDRKNSSSSVVKGDIFPNTPTLGSFVEASRGLAHDTARLVGHGVLLGGDSFNLGRGENGLHLFLNDLAHTEFEDLNEEDAADYARRASMRAVDALLSGLSRKEYDRYRDFFDGDAFHFRHGQAYKQFTDIVLAEAGISS